MLPLKFMENEGNKKTVLNIFDAFHWLKVGRREIQIKSDCYMSWCGEEAIWLA